MTTTLPTVHACTYPWCIARADTDGDSSVHDSAPLIVDACAEVEHHTVSVEAAVWTGDNPLKTVSISIDRQFADLTIDQARQLITNLTTAVGYAEAGGVS